MLHWVDIVIIVVIALSVLTGLVRGFVKELIALCVWILAIWAAFKYSQNLDPWLQRFIVDKTARTATAFILMMLAILIVGGIANALLSFILKRSGLSSMDRIFGMGFGFIRGIFLVALVMVVIKMTSLPHKEYSHESKLYAKFDPVVNWLYDLLPDFVHKAKIFDNKLSPTSPPDKAELDKSASIIDFVPEFSDA
ncbi:CvpA family protein [Legionella fairfieldensis]|uniref:CvpA family protein n=1 Tax=Legionella fairfieldensis TaxID=45064 RepID=UPI0009FF5502|nr:CvpA family protein [Legionella fairfieldensis]